MKNIKFSEAIEKMNTGDVFSPYANEYAEFIMNKNGTFRGSECENSKELPLGKHQLALIGQIIPAEPVVLSAEEIAKSVTYRDVNTYCWSDILQICETADKNGQLKRDRDYRPLVAACEKYIKAVIGSDMNIKKALKNLKPL